jgi:hypothetical protein
MPTVSEFLRIGNELRPYVERFMDEAEKSGLPGTSKKENVLNLVGTVYEGARRLGVLDGVKEVRGVEWAALAPFIGWIIDGLVAFYNAIGRWRSKSSAQPTPEVSG